MPFIAAETPLERQNFACIYIFDQKTRKMAKNATSDEMYSIACSDGKKDIYCKYTFFLGK